MAFFIAAGCYLTGLLVKFVFHRPRAFLSRRWSNSEWNTHIAQPIVAAFFVCLFTSRIPKEHHWLILGLLCVLIALLGWIGSRVRANYRPDFSGTVFSKYCPQFSGVLFDERFVRPVWDWIQAQRRVLTWLGRIPPLRPVAWALEFAVDRIHRRRWQLFLGTLLALSLYTLPVTLAEPLDTLVFGPIETSVPQWIKTSPLFGQSYKVVHAIYLYLFDWLVTIYVLYAVIVLVSALEPRNIFRSVDEALQDFVNKRKIFSFSGLFWQYSASELNRIKCTQNEEQQQRFAAYAQALHDESLRLDGPINGSWQGINSRIALIYETPATGKSGERQSHCVHYRRLGRSAFLVAVDADASRFDGTNSESQIKFHQLSESIGYLVNVRDSLK
jgi:hypothetical protein